MATILVIEDEKLLREDIGEVLMLEAFDVVEAPNGRAGIQTAIQQQPDLILCDISMPEADGYEVLGTLRSHRDTAEIPFIFLTARVDSEFVRKAEGMGVDEYMTKPFSNAQLMETIRVFLEQRAILSAFRAATIERLKQQIVPLVAHELRAYSVLAADIPAVVARPLDAADSNGLLARVNASHHHVDYLAKQLGNLVRLELGLVSPQKIQNMGMIVSARLLLQSAVNRARQLMACFQPEAVSVAGDDEQIHLQCDSRALRQALADPILQALNASPDHPVLISQQVSDAQVSITVAHENTGHAEPGVPELLNGSQGALQLSRQIIQAHGGTLRADDPRQVEIVLPLVKLNMRYG